MRLIKLSSDEKRLLRNVQAEVNYWPDGMSDERIACAASALEHSGLVVVMWESGHFPAAIELTDFGVAYLIRNPHLHNPVDWRWIVGTIIAVGMLAATIMSVLASCKIIDKIQ